jgi:enoyl-CoA hydratase/carnithine racemase
MDHINVEVAEGIGTITITRYDEARNAFNDQTKSEILSTLDKYRDDDGVRVVVFRSEGDIFSAGGDMKEGGEHTHSIPVIKSAAEDWEDLYLTLRNLGKPTLAIVDGDAIAGAVDLLLFTDFVIAAESAEFHLPEVFMSHVDYFNVSVLPHLVGPNEALKFILTGGPIDAAEAKRIGMITDVAPADELDNRAGELTADLLEASPRMVKILKDAVYSNMELSPGAAFMHTKQISMENLRTNPNYKSGFEARLE